jgi:hypothetical protein
MKPSLIVFIPTACMSVCFLAALFAGQPLLACAAFLIMCLGYGLVLTLEESGK